jgi:hypothetical protein
LDGWVEPPAVLTAARHYFIKPDATSGVKIMRRLILLMLMTGLAALLSSIPAGAGPAARHGRQVQPKPPQGPVIGYVKDENLVDMCGCTFEHRTSRRGETFAGEAGGKNAWMNIDGEDVKLTLTRSAGPKRARIGSRYVETYEAEGVKATLVMTVTSLCIPYGPECETTGYRVTITVRKGGRVRSVRAGGQCGCV